MKIFRIKLLALCCLLSGFLFAVNAQNLQSKATLSVNPFIGTGAVNGSSLSGNNFPGATVPFGMVQLSPDTKGAPSWDAASGYNYNDKTIAGFSHTHLSGTGVSELFDILVMPMTGEFKTRAGDANQPENGYRSRFSHEQESARPGYYQVKLLDYDINAELTALDHTGFHRYTYPANSDGHLIFDLDHSKKRPDWGCHVIKAQFKIIDERTLEGYRVITGWAPMRKVYFHAKFSKPFLKTRLVDGGTVREDCAVINGTDLRAILDFDTKDGEPLLVKIGISAVSVQNAKENLQTEISHWDFDKVVAEADQKWEKELAKIQVDGTDKQKEIFYTALYHAFIQPNNQADVNGEYMASDYSTQHADDGVQYSTFSLWDTYRATHPLYTLIQPERTAGFVNSLVRQYDTYGYLPIWQFWNQENYCMIGNHAIPVVVDAALKGLTGMELEKIYEAVKNSSVVSHLNSPFEIWDKYGYMPEDLQSQSVSLTLEMAYDDWCVAQLAKKLGKDADYAYFMKRSQYFRNLYEPESGFFQAKNSDGKWLSPFDPFQYGANGGHPFTEGNAWQYFWYVPQDISGLIDLVGGNEKFVQKLDKFFSTESTSEHINNNASGFIGQYAHGNEPSHHVTYLYNFVGQPWKTQYYTSKVIQELYTTTSSGYAGNEDCGQMSSWYVFSALGFYPVNPSNGIYMIGSPAFKKSVIHISDNKSFTVICKKQSDKNVYIQSARLNGEKFNRTYLTHQEIIAGGVLEFTMGSKPNKRWGVKSGSVPNSN